MMIEEFTERTGYEPGMEEYTFIEQSYVEANIHKDDFCRAWKKDFEDGHWAKELKLRRELQAEKDGRKLDNECLTASIDALNDAIKNLETQLDRELEWQPYEPDSNVKQDDYDRLAADSCTEELDDEEAAGMIADEFGFARDKIKIVHQLAVYEINRHGRLRRSGTAARKALFNEWDWNYIAFEVRGILYEMHDGDLQMYH